MKNKIILLIIHLICDISFGSVFVLAIFEALEVGALILLGLSTTCWLVATIIDFIEIIEMMETVYLRCPKCNKKIQYKNWFDWMLHSPMHWFSKRYTKCHCCNKWSWMKREK